MGNTGERIALIRWLRPPIVALCVVVLLLPGMGTPTQADMGTGSGRSGGGENAVRALEYVTGVPVCRQTANMVLNPSFEDGLGADNNWEMNKYCAYESTGTTAYDGALSARILPSDFRNKECNLFTIIENLEIDGGQVYDYAAWVKAHVTDGEALLRVSFWGSQGAALKEIGTAATNAVVDTAGEWFEITGSVLAPPGADYARVEAILTAGAGEGSWVYVDDVYLGRSVCMELALSDAPDPVMAGADLAYTFHYANVGRGAATGVEVTAKYDRHVEWESAHPPPSQGEDTWLIPALAASEEGAIAVVVEVDDDLPPPNWILSTVDVGSAETIGRVRESITTQVQGQPGACQVEISVIPASQETPLGVPARYEVLVMNTGDRDGEVTLTAASSFATTHCLPQRFPLHAGASRPATITVELSEYVPDQGMSHDVTHLTASLDCGEYGGRDQVAGTVATTFLLPGYLPALVKDHDARQCRTEAWETESTGGVDNDHAWTADGPLCPDRGYYGTPDDGWDWFKIWLPTRSDLTIDLLDHVGTGVQLVLYYDSTENIVARDCTLASPYHIDYADAPAGLYYVLIYTESGFDWYTPYTLFAHFR